jgi:hypothetical protein
VASARAVVQVMQHVRAGLQPEEEAGSRAGGQAGRRRRNGLDALPMNHMPHRGKARWRERVTVSTVRTNDRSSVLPCHATKVIKCEERRTGMVMENELS